MRSHPGHKQGWLERRREAKRIKAEREGDTPQRAAERRHGTPDPTAKGSAGQASIGAAVNTLPQ